MWWYVTELIENNMQLDSSELRSVFPGMFSNTQTFATGQQHYTDRGYVKHTRSRGRCLLFDLSEELGQN